MLSMHHYLRPLLAPKSIALVGASERPGSIGRIVYENLLAGGYKGELYPINPNHRRVLAQPTFDSLTAIGKPVDLAIVATPADVVIDVLEDAPRVNLQAAVLMSAPKATSAAVARAWTRRVAATARRHGVRLLGPGALGVIRTDIGLNATFCAPVAHPGRLAIIAQSGAVATAMLDFAAPLGIGFSTVVSLGGGIDVDFGELLDAMVLDPATDGILLYVEEEKDARSFLSALRAAARTKPVVVLKAGRSVEARQVPTADAVFDAALKRSGTVRVHTYTQLFAAARILATGRIPNGDRLAIVSNGRGPAVLAADSALSRGVPLATLAAPTVATLDTFLPQNSARANPVDVRGNAQPDRIAAALSAVLADPNVDAALALHVARPTIGTTDSARAVADVARKQSKPVLAAWLGAIARHEVREALEAGGVADFFTPENAVEAFSFLAEYRRNQALLLEVPSPQPEPETPDFDTAERLRSTAALDKRTRLTASDGYALLAAFGIVAPPFAVVETLREAQAAARKMHFPVTLALEGAPHAGGADRREVRTSAGLSKAWGELHAEVSLQAHEGWTGNVVVRRRVAATGARAYAVGVACDRVFGPVITFGAGGGDTGFEPPSALMLPPLNRVLALELIARARGAHHIAATTAAAESAERDALARMLTQVSTMVCALPWVRHVVLDPVVVVRNVAYVLGVRVAIDPRKRPGVGYRHMAIHPYPVEMIDDVTLRGGTLLHVRPIRPEDAEMERNFVNGLSEQTRFYRFFYHLHELTPAMLARFTQVDYDREMALVAIATDLEGRNAIIGVARYIANPDQETAEFAVVVGDAWQGLGVARVLMERLIKCGRRRGLTALKGTVLRANHNMLRFTEAIGFVTRDDPEDPEQVEVVLKL